LCTFSDKGFANKATTTGTEPKSKKEAKKWVIREVIKNRTLSLLLYLNSKDCKSLEYVPN
jgi:hypothetical protein